MWVWRNAQQPERETLGVSRGISRAALEGKARPALMKEAITALLASGQADRVGVWIETTDQGIANSEPCGTFRGIVAEKGGEATPPEWSRLLPQAPLPADLLANLKTVEQDVDDSSGAPMIGALIEMRRVLWVPLQTHVQLRGVLLVASRRKQARLPGRWPNRLPPNFL